MYARHHGPNEPRYARTVLAYQDGGEADRSRIAHDYASQDGLVVQESGTSQRFRQINWRVSYLFCGERGGNRTYNLLIKSRPKRRAHRCSGLLQITQSHCPSTSCPSIPLLTLVHPVSPFEPESL